jgi:hypothetical protein
MKIESGRGVGSPSAPRRAGQAVTPGFTPSAEEPPPSARASGVGGVATLDMVVALQADEPPAQRRARQARRGKASLDALEALEQGLITGRAPGSLRAELERLRCGAELTGEPGLDDVLREIDTRVAVELAKLERLVGAA